MAKKYYNQKGSLLLKFVQVSFPKLIFGRIFYQLNWHPAGLPKCVNDLSCSMNILLLKVINDMITFRCSNESCEVGFPLKENTKEKVIACPMKECGKETNVWLKLKRIQARDI